MKWRYVVAVWLVALGALWFFRGLMEEKVLVRRLAEEMRFATSMNDGRRPASWRELETGSEFPDLRAVERYAFLAGPLEWPLPYGEKRELVMMTRSPFREARPGNFGMNRWSEPGRYLIMQVPSEKPYSLGYQFVEEARVQEVFRGSEGLLPAPESVPIRWRETQMMLYAVARWVAWVLGWVLGVKLVIFFTREVLLSMRPRVAAADGKPGRVWDY